MRGMTKEEKIRSFDGTELYLKRDIPDAPKAVAVIVHGLCEHQGRYDHLTERFCADGIAVYRFDHRGHGRSEGKRVYYSDFNEIVDDVHVVTELAKREQPGLPLFVVGHSMGGYAATLFATKYPGEAAGIILSGALTRYNTPCAGPLPVDAPADSYVPNALGSGVCSDPAVVEAYGRDPYVEKEISIGLLNSIWGGIQWLKANAACFTDPVIMLHGACDGLVSEKDSRELFGDIASSDKTLKIYAHLFHEIFNEPCKDEILDEVLAWIKKRI